MRRYHDSEVSEEPYYLAGEVAPAGQYQNVASGRQVSLTSGDRLPASLNGHVACYRRLAYTWRNIHAEVDTPDIGLHPASNR